MNRSLFTLGCALAVGLGSLVVAQEQPGQGTAQGQPAVPGQPEPPPDFPPAEEVIQKQGYEKVVSTADGAKSFYTMWRRDKDQQMLAELPVDFAKQKHFLALTVASGAEYAGLQAGDLYFYWRQYGKRLALVMPSVDIRSTGDAESQASVKRLYTDKVILDVPILTWIPKGGPVIDVDELCVNNASKFFGDLAKDAKVNLFTIKTAKAFPANVELAFEVACSDGQLRSFHYSFSLMPDNTGYQPRLADERVGFFTTTYTDFGKFEEEQTTVRYINRWHLEKADPSLQLSPPKTPIIFYLEHTTPVRYRRWVKDGALMWNKAFEKVGLVNVIEIRFQDATTGENMDKDPEDVRYNFIRWLSNGEGTAIGPCRTHPLTGQILDADVVLTDGWIRHWWKNYNEIIPQIAMEGMTPTTMTWLLQNPQWDPRIRLAEPEQRQQMIDARSREPLPALGGHPLARAGQRLSGANEFDGLANRSSQFNGHCNCANCKTNGLALMHMSLELAADGPPPVPGEQVLDGIPESFIGPLLMDLTVHEVGHTIGLRHNFRGSGIYSYQEINSDQIKGKKAFASSVMDYIPINIVAGKQLPQGDFGMIAVGPYDEWAIEYGYSFEMDLKPVLARSADPLLQYATDEDSAGPDPLARRYDFGRDPLAYAENQMQLVKDHRSKLMERFVKDGESWAKLRRGYSLTLSTQVHAVMMMSQWLGGSFINRQRKGDPNATAPVQPVPAEQQRAALKFVIANTFEDAGYGLTTDLLRHMTVDKWWDQKNQFDEPTWPIHDKIGGIQASVLTMILNPTTLSRIYDNEFRTAADQDAVTLPEVLDVLVAALWTEVDQIDPAKQYTPRQPLISSLRRNLQRECLERLADLANNKLGDTSAAKPISDLALAQLDTLKGKLANVAGTPNLDAYTRAHIKEAVNRITKLQESRYLMSK